MPAAYPVILPETRDNTQYPPGFSANLTEKLTARSAHRIDLVLP